MAFLLRNSLKLSIERKFFKVYCQQVQQEGLHTNSVFLNPYKQSTDTTQPKDSAKTQKKQKELIKITLIQNENMTVTALEEAKNLAKRRSMHLVKVQGIDNKTQRPVYKLLTAADMLNNELSDVKKSDKSATKKSEKCLNIGSRIAEHDLSSRLKNIAKWLNKQHEVRILIQGSSQTDLPSSEKTFKTIEEAIKTPQVIGRIVQKRTKGSIIKFSILPVAAPAPNENSANQ